MARVRRPGLDMVLKSTGSGQTALLPPVAALSVSSVMRRECVAAVVAIVFLRALAPDPAAAQGFFQSLFGSPAQQPAFKPQPQPRRAVESPYGYQPTQRARDRDNDPDDERGSRAFDKSGRYRTLCVRMCDGYYWPISFAARRSNFYQDTNLCRSSCGEEARLFFHSSRDGDTKDMVDVTGRAYAKLPTAYLYRRSTVEGCKCKPEPWAQTEIDRHRLYALNEASERQRSEAGAVAGVVAPPEKQVPGISDKAVALRFAQLDAAGNAPARTAAAGEKIAGDKKSLPAAARIVTAELAPPSDPTVAARAKTGAQESPEPSIPELEPREFTAPVVARPLVSASPVSPSPIATPALEARAKPEAGESKSRRAERTVRPERPVQHERPAQHERPERRQAAADSNRPRSAQAKTHAAKPSGMFGLGAGSKAARWPGE